MPLLLLSVGPGALAPLTTTFVARHAILPHVGCLRAVWGVCYHGCHHGWQDVWGRLYPRWWRGLLPLAAQALGTEGAAATAAARGLALQSRPCSAPPLLHEGVCWAECQAASYAMQKGHQVLWTLVSQPKTNYRVCPSRP